MCESTWFLYFLLAFHRCLRSFQGRRDETISGMDYSRADKSSRSGAAATSHRSKLFKLDEQTNERTSEQTNERTNERTNKRTNRLTDGMERSYQHGASGYSIHLQYATNVQQILGVFPLRNTFPSLRRSPSPWFRRVRSPSDRRGGAS